MAPKILHAIGLSVISINEQLTVKATENNDTRNVKDVKTNQDIAKYKKKIIQ